KNMRDRRYMRIKPAVAERMFPRRMAFLHEGRRFPFQFSLPVPVELFLSPFGVGALTFSLELDCRPQLDDSLDRYWMDTPEGIVRFNYRVSQLQEWAAPKIRISHPSDDPVRWARIREDQKARIAPAAGDLGLTVQKMNVAGAEYSLPELIEFLLKETLDHHTPDGGEQAGLFKVTHNPLSVYSVVRFGAEVDFCDDGMARALGRMLSALAQLEESSHAGSLPGKVQIPNELMNTKHWAA